MGTSKYSAEFRADAVALYRSSLGGTYASVAKDLGINHETLRVWVRDAEQAARPAYGRIFKSLDILAYIDTDETYRRDIKHIRNLQERRRDLARTICHGRKGELYHHYDRGLENQLGVLGLFSIALFCGPRCT